MIKYRVNPDYIHAAMEHAVFEEMEGGEGYFGFVPEFPGAWANQPTLEATRDELPSVLEGWIELALEGGHELPDERGIQPAL